MRKSSEAKNPIDIPVDELVQLATRERAKGWTVYFKFSCPYCGERCTLTKANNLYPRGECFKCHKECEIDVGGFALTSVPLPEDAPEESPEKGDSNVET